MKNTKKLLSAFLSAAGSVLLLSGCGASETTSDSGSPAVAPAAVSSNEMRDITSMEIVKDMGIGWNLGDTLDVCQALN